MARAPQYVIYFTCSVLVVQLAAALGTRRALAAVVQELQDRLQALELENYELKGRVAVLERFRVRAKHTTPANASWCSCNAFLGNVSITERLSAQHVVSSGDSSVGGKLSVTGDVAVQGSAVLNGVDIAQLSDSTLRNSGNQVLNGELTVEKLHIGPWTIAIDGDQNLRFASSNGDQGAIVSANATFDAGSIKDLSIGERIVAPDDSIDRCACYIETEVQSCNSARADGGYVPCEGIGIPVEVNLGKLQSSFAPGCSKPGFMIAGFAFTGYTTGYSMAGFTNFMFDEKAAWVCCRPCLKS